MNIVDGHIHGHKRKLESIATRVVEIRHFTRGGRMNKPNTKKTRRQTLLRLACKVDEMCIEQKSLQEIEDFLNKDEEATTIMKNIILNEFSNRLLI